MGYDIEEDIRVCIEIANGDYNLSHLDEPMLRFYKEICAKAKAWQKLKEEILNEYPGAVNIQKYYAGSYEFAIVQKLEEIGNKMDELDGTHEFSNLLDDMNMEDK
ncbi:hypothetical protein [Mammaliicoccus lentus]|uniref:hypothetical protein n=1 Tax=Mammaliicoccus lentus TaxID=42858 RepID=UPI002DBB0A09|nr:hypothetical protein [Mammaliicoccus lentus]MEB8093157.1 hypothetical protein [Mammaliicoccus lentus]